MVVLAAIFILGTLVIFFTYIGFPLCLVLVSNIRNKVVSRTNKTNLNDLPIIQVVVSCYNEENIIGKRLDNILEQFYPKDKLSVLVISDGSTDGSPEIIRSYSQDDPRVVLFETPANVGKNLAINLAFDAGACQGKLLCFTDADAEFDPMALANAARLFTSQKVGLVGGKITYWLSSKSASQAEGAFWRLENFIRKTEGDLGSLVSCTGLLIMMRRELFQPLRPEHNTDFALPLMVLAQGYAARFASEAKVLSLFPAGQKEVLRRRKRTVIRALTTMAHYRQRLPWHVQQILFWHKTMRFYLFPVQVSVLIANVLLVAGSPSLVWQAFLILQLSFYGGAILGWLAERFNLKVPLAYLPYQFTLQNALVFSAVLDYLRGNRVAKWTPPR
jgi:poly-beta-1,6-N-acetyl-D-glucosamine synthase